MDLLAQFRKSVASVALAAMFVFLTTPIASAARLGFTDDAEIPSWAEEAIQELMDQGVISGNDDGSFAPNRQLNRAEVSKVIALASGVDMDTTGGPHFPDVAENAWYYDYIETMYNYGWINGYPDGLFRPAVGINRAEIAKMAINAFELDQDLSGAPHFDDVSESDWFYGYIETAYNNGLMRGYGDGTFGPANAVTRAETVAIVYNSQLVWAEPVGPAEGTLEAMLSYDTPRGTNVPYNATSVPYTTVELTASDDSDVEISSLTFTRLGLGDNDDFENVWLEIDGFKVGNDKSVNNDDIVELRFNPPIVVPAGQTIVADVVASAKYTATDKNVGHHSRFALVSADDVVSTAANVVGAFPLEGEEMEVADYEVSQLTFTTLGSDTTVDVGDNFIEIGKFRMLNGSNTNKDVEVRAVTFKNDGTAELEDDLENVALYVSGEQVSAETIIDGDYVTFRLDNGVTGGYVVEDGDSKIFSIRADIVSAEAGDTIAFKVDNYEDVVAVEIGTSFGCKAVDSSGNNAEDANATLATYSIDSGDLNVSRDPSSLGNQQYSPGSNDVVALTARLVVDQPLLVDGVLIGVGSGSVAATTTNGGVAKSTACTTGTANSLACMNATFDNFRLFLNDKLVDTENDFELVSGGTDTTVTDYQLNFNTTFEIAGTSILKIVMNVQDVAKTADKLKLEIAAADFQSPEYISTGDQVASTGLLGSATGSFVEVTASVLTVTETSGLSNGDKLVAGVDDVTFMELVMDNNDSGDVNVTSMTVGVDTAANTDASTLNVATADSVSGSARTYTNFTLAVFVEGTQQGSAKNLNSDGKATFNDLSVVIPSAGQKEFAIVVDTIEASATAITTAVDDGAIANGNTDIMVESSAGMTVGDIIAISESTASGTTYHAITAITNNVENGCSDGTTDTCDKLTFANDALATATLAQDNDVVTVLHQIKIDLEDVDADNVENGQTVTVTDNGADEIVVTDNEVAGTQFQLVSSGTLTVSREAQVGPGILVGGQQNVEVLKLRMSAANDEVQVKDFYFINDVNNDNAEDSPTTDTTTAIEDRVDFLLYNKDGQFVQRKQMAGGQLHFELANQDRIRVSKDGSTFVTVKVDVDGTITQANRTGKRLQLAFDTTHSTKGIEAVTAATGDDITTPTAGWGDVTGEDFVAYRTNLIVAPAATQPTFSGPATAHQEVYRFTVSADSAHSARLERLTMDVEVSGMCARDTAGNRSCGDDLDIFQDSDFEVYRVSGGDADRGTSITDSVVSYNESGNHTGARVVVDFTNEIVSAGSPVTYALFIANTAQNGANQSNDDAVTVTFLRDEGYDTPTTMTLMKAGTTPAASSADGSTTTILVPDAEALAAGLIDADLGAVTYTEAIGRYAVVTDAVTAANSRLVRITNAVSDNTDTTFTFTPAVGAATANADNDTIVLHSVAVWSDESASNHSTTSADWLNGYQTDIKTGSAQNGPY